MKPKTLAMMLGLVLGLGAFIWFFEKDVPSTEERAVQDKKVFGGLKSEEVTAVKVVRDGKTVRFERDAKAAEPVQKAGAASASSASSAGGPPSTAADRPWRIVEPIVARADKWAVDRLVDSLVNLTKDSTLDSSDRQGLGLDEPRAKVTLTANGSDTVLEIGAVIPASSNMAVAIAGGPPVVVPSYVFTDLSKEPGEWRSKDLFPGLRDDIQRIVLKPGAAAPGIVLKRGAVAPGMGSEPGADAPGIGLMPGIVLVKKGEEYRLEAPVADRADRDAVNTLLGDLTALQAAKFIDGPPEGGTNVWRDSVEVTLKGRPQPWRLEIGGTTQEPEQQPAPGSPDAKPALRTVVRADGVLAETESKIDDAVRKPAADWRSPRWASFEVFRVEAFDVDDAKGHLSLKRHDADWTRGADRIAFTPVSDLLYAVTGARGEKLLSRAAAVAAGASFTKPVATLKLIAADRSSETLTLFPSLADGSAPAVASGRDDVVVVLNKTFVDDLTSKLQALRGAEPLTAKASEGAGKQD